MAQIPHTQQTFRERLLSKETELHEMLEETAMLRGALDRLYHSCNRVREEMSLQLLDGLPMATRMGLDLALVEAKRILDR